MAPPSQKPDARPISFYLDPGDGSQPIYMPLVIRPEDLVRSEPSLLTPQMTFDGAWADDFGPGLSTIQISGHTGWGSGSLPNGIDTWLTLRDTVFAAWHGLRAQAVAHGRSADTVKLIFSDKLDEIVATVATGQIVLKRNRSRPLLMMYQISMTVLSDSIQDPTTDPLSLTPSQAGVLTGLDSLQASLNKLTAAAANLRSFIQSSVIAPVHSFMAMANTVLAKVMVDISAARGIITAQSQQLIGFAADITLVGRNVFNTFNAVAGLPGTISHELAEVSAAYHNAFCVLTNAFQAVKQYPDYSAVYGASVCSSTVGGSPISSLTGVNTFDYVTPLAAAPVSVSQDARVQIEALKRVDTVLNPPSVADAASRVAVVAAGSALAQ